MTSSFDPIYKKTDAGSVSHESSPQLDSDRHISPVIGHELNNILAIVQGYADRLLIKYSNDAALCSQLKMITDAARRAAVIIRDATPPVLTTTSAIGQNETEPTAA